MVFPIPWEHRSPVHHHRLTRIVKTRGTMVRSRLGHTLGWDAPFRLRLPTSRFFGHLLLSSGLIQWNIH
jgi:hypothetical protein